MRITHFWECAFKKNVDIKFSAHDAFKYKIFHYISAEVYVIHLCVIQVCQLLPDRCIYKGMPVFSIQKRKGIRVKVILFNAAINNISVISWRSVLLVEET